MSGSLSQQPGDRARRSNAKPDSGTPVTRETQQSLGPHPRLDRAVLPDNEAVLSFAEIRAADTIAGLRQAYQNKKIIFEEDPADKKLLDRIAKDWAIAQRVQALKIHNEVTSLPDTFPHLEVNLGKGPPIRIIGILHSLQLDADLLVLLRKQTVKLPLLLCEHNLGVANFGIHSGGIDLPDQATKGLGMFLLSHHLSMHKYIFRSICGKFNDFFKREKMSLPKFTPSTAEARQLDAIKSLIGKTDQRMAFVARAYLRFDSDLLDQYPASVRLELKQRNAVALNDCEARSAFLAEVLRAWDPKKTIDSLNLSKAQRKALPSEAIDSRWLLNGAAHTREIEYFLHHGTNNQKIIERAHKISEMLNKGQISQVVGKAHMLNNVGLLAHTVLVCAESYAFFWVGLKLLSKIL